MQSPKVSKEGRGGDEAYQQEGLDARKPFRRENKKADVIYVLNPLKNSIWTEWRP